MKKKTILIVWVGLFLFFYICADSIGAASFALISNMILLGLLLLYFFVFHILRLTYIPRHNILIWLLLTTLSLPLIIGLTEMGVMPDSSVGNGGMEHVFFIPINLCFILCLCIENLIGRYFLHIRD